MSRWGLTAPRRDTGGCSTDGQSTRVREMGAVEARMVRNQTSPVQAEVLLESGICVAEGSPCSSWRRALRSRACSSSTFQARLCEHDEGGCPRSARGSDSQHYLLCGDLFWPPGCSTPKLETHGDFSKNRGLLKDQEKQLKQMWGISLRRV